MIQIHERLHIADSIPTYMVHPLRTTHLIYRNTFQSIAIVDIPQLPSEIAVPQAALAAWLKTNSSY